MKLADWWVIKLYLQAEGIQKEIFSYLMGYISKTDPAERFKLLTTGRDLAVQHQEHWLALYLEHRRLEVLLHEIGDHQVGLEEVIRVIVEARKPLYDQHPQRICIQKNLIAVHSSKDPRGNADLIQKAFDYMESQIEPDLQCYFCLLSLKISFDLELDNVEAATEKIEHLLALSKRTGDNNEYAGACLDMGIVCYRQKKWEELWLWAAELEQLDNKKDEGWNWNYRRICYLAWQALARYQLGEENEARHYYQRAVAKAGEVKFSLPGIYYDALSTYHEARGEGDKAVKIRERQLEALLNTGQTYQEYQCRYELCRLLLKMGQPAQKALAEARLVAQHLKQPEQYLANLAQLEAQTLSDP